MKFFGRIWRGEISLAWAYWGVGIGGLFPLLAIAPGISGLIALLQLMNHRTIFGFSLIDYLITFGSLLVLGGQSVVIWRAANRTSRWFWRRSAKVIVIMTWLLPPLTPPVLLLLMAVAHFTPIKYQDIGPPYDKATLHETFRHFVKNPLPQDAEVLFVDEFRMADDYMREIVFRVENIEEWQRLTRPFGTEWRTGSPEIAITSPRFDRFCEQVNQGATPNEFKTAGELVATRTVCRSLGERKQAGKHGRPILGQHPFAQELYGLIESIGRYQGDRTVVLFPEEKLIWFHMGNW